jgi:hypothetical protein
MLDVMQALAQLSYLLIMMITATWVNKEQRRGMTYNGKRGSAA